MPRFIATPHTAAGAIVDLAPAVGLKTILQVGIPAASFITIVGWGISSTGTVGTDSPFYAYLMESDVAASVGTSLTPDPWDVPGGQASVCVGGAALTSYNAAYTEGTIAASRVFDSQKIHPQTGYGVWFPADVRPRAGLIASARSLRIRVNQISAAYNLVPWVVWDE